VENSVLTIFGISAHFDFFYFLGVVIHKGKNALKRWKIGVILP